MARGDLSGQILTQILDHARANDYKAGQHLPAQGLADTFRVSRAPVVGALKKLAAQGVVRSEQNRGFYLATNAADLPSEAVRVTSEEALYFRMGEDRLARRLPDRISESELMRLYDVPRSKLLRILHRIAEEGWILRLPGNGWEFRETLTSPKSYADAYQFRASIEMQALLQPSFRIDEEAFAAERERQTALLTIYKDESRSVIFGRNIEFHEMLMRCANNSFFLDAVQRINRLRRLIEYRITKDRSRLPQQSREHLQILDLIESRDMQAAATFLYHHVREAGKMKAALFE